VARRSNTPKQFKADVRRAARGFKGAATVSRRIGYNVNAMRVLRGIAAENNRKNFATNGSAMGDNWKGARTGNAILQDAVATGALMREMTRPYALKPRVTAKQIYFSVPPRKIPYIRFLAPRLYGWTPKSVDNIADAITTELLRIAKGGA